MSERSHYRSLLRQKGEAESLSGLRVKIFALSQNGKARFGVDSVKGKKICSHGTYGSMREAAVVGASVLADSDTKVRNPKRGRARYRQRPTTLPW